MNVAALSMPQTNRWLMRIGWVLLLLGALFAAGNAVLFMTMDGHGGSEFKARLLGDPFMGWSHTMGGAIAALIGPFQFLSVLRNRHRTVHVWLGRTYLIAVMFGGIGGLYFAPTSVGESVGAAGFTLLGIVWLFTGWMAYSAIRRRNVAAHRRWMIRNYALTFAAATLRIELIALAVVGLPFLTAFKTVAWSSWVPNLLVVEAWIRKSQAEDRRL
jgi:uncharacterized membrane protein